MLGLLPDHLDDLFASDQLVDPLLPHPLDLPAELVLLEPHDQLSHLAAVDLLDEVDEHQLDHLALALDRLEHAVELLREVLEDGGLFGESILVLLNEVRHLDDVEAQDAHDLEVDALGRVGGGEADAEGGVVEEVFVDVADEVFDYLVHVVVHHRHSLTPRGAEPLQHELYLPLDLVVGTHRVGDDVLQPLVRLRLALQEVLDLRYKKGTS